MKRAILTSAAVVALIAAAGGGFIAGRAQPQPGGTPGMTTAKPSAAQTGGEPAYYQDPDGRPLYSLTPMKTPDGRDYRGVPAGVGGGSHVPASGRLLLSDEHQV